jgi:hypothetical protein
MSALWVVFFDEAQGTQRLIVMMDINEEKTLHRQSE